MTRVLKQFYHLRKSIICFLPTHRTFQTTWTQNIQLSQYQLELELVEQLSMLNVAVPTKTLGIRRLIRRSGVLLPLTKTSYQLQDLDKIFLILSKAFSTIHGIGLTELIQMPMYSLHQHNIIITTTIIIPRKISEIRRLMKVSGVSLPPIETSYQLQDLDKTYLILSKVFSTILGIGLIELIQMPMYSLHQHNIITDIIIPRKTSETKRLMRVSGVLPLPIEMSFQLQDLDKTFLILSKAFSMIHGIGLIELTLTTKLPQLHQLHQLSKEILGIRRSSSQFGDLQPMIEMFCQSQEQDKTLPTHKMVFSTSHGIGSISQHLLLKRNKKLVYWLRAQTLEIQNTLDQMYSKLLTKTSDKSTLQEINQHHQEVLSHLNQDKVLRLFQVDQVL